MSTYIIRRLFQGIIVLFLSTFMIYSLLMVTPGGPQDMIRQMRAQQQGGKPINERLIIYYTQLYGLDKPYPLDYFLWLFDPSKTTDTSYDLAGNPTTSTIGINIFGIAGSG